jgi:hypothetical protein
LGALVVECLTAPMGPTSVVAVEEECAELEREGDEGREKGGGVAVGIRWCVGEHRDRGRWGLVEGFYLRGTSSIVPAPNHIMAGWQPLGPSSEGRRPATWPWRRHGLGKANDRMGWGPHVIDTKRTGGINIKGFERPLRTGLGGKI